eukprot:10595417-Heterocapsa_arctica.AAC.1
MPSNGPSRSERPTSRGPRPQQTHDKPKQPKLQASKPESAKKASSSAELGNPKDSKPSTGTTQEEHSLKAAAGPARATSAGLSRQRNPAAKTGTLLLWSRGATAWNPEHEPTGYTRSGPPSAATLAGTAPGKQKALLGHHIYPAALK